MPPSEEGSPLLHYLDSRLFVIIGIICISFENERHCSCANLVHALLLGRFFFPITPSASPRQGTWLSRPDPRLQIENTLHWVHVQLERFFQCVCLENKNINKGFDKLERSGAIFLQAWNLKFDLQTGLLSIYGRERLTDWWLRKISIETGWSFFKSNVAWMSRGGIRTKDSSLLFVWRGINLLYF